MSIAGNGGKAQSLPPPNEHPGRETGRKGPSRNDPALRPPVLRILTYAGLLIAAGMILAGLIRPALNGELPGSTSLPDGFSLVETVTGPAAAAMVDRLHGRSVTPRENVIDRYSTPGGMVTVYRSLYASEEEAASVAARMREKIRTIGFGFSMYAELGERGVTVARCAGQGRIHFFFAASHQVYWIEAEPENVPAAWTTVTHMLRSE